MVELMVALVLGVILTSGVISVFISSKNTYNTNNSLGQVEEGGRYALNFMQPILSLAGNTGCSRTGDSRQQSGYTDYIPTTIINSAYLNGTTPYAPMYNFGLPVFGYEATGTGINATIPSNGGETVSGGVETYPSPDTNPADWSPALNWNDPKNVLSGALNVNAVGGVLKYNDVLMVHEALTTTAIGGGAATVVAATDSSAVYVPASTSSAVTTAANFNAGEFAIASNCTNTVDAFQITSVTNSSGALGYAGSAPTGTPGNNGSSLATFITTDGYSVLPASTYVFYVGEGADKGPALFEGYLGTTSNPGKFVTEQLVSGVESMQVLYGVDTDQDQIPNYFTTADQVQSGTGGSGAGGNANWGSVVSVRVSLVMQSDNFSIDKASTSTTNVYMLGSGRGYTDNTILATPADQRMRRVFVETFSFRNMLP
jgi:type IV pilus assembly protein PilW